MIVKGVSIPNQICPLRIPILVSKVSGADEGAGSAHPTPPPPRDDLRFSNTTGILQKKKKTWFTGVEVEQETSAPPPKKNPGSAPER